LRLAGRLRSLSGADVCRILQENGFTEVRQRRSLTSTITVPVPLHAELRLGTLASIKRLLKSTSTTEATPL
jgi:predicted RNA binding protein YcfA (HicA-like mRNA interferase family)